MIVRKAVSPFISTLILIAITLAIGGFLYTQFGNYVTSQVKTASFTVLYSNVSYNGMTITVVVKNDGNVPLKIEYVDLTSGYGTYNFTSFRLIPANATMNPGEVRTIVMNLNFSLPPFSSYTLTIVTDKVAKSFDLIS